MAETPENWCSQARAPSYASRNEESSVQNPISGSVTNSTPTRTPTRPQPKTKPTQLRSPMSSTISLSKSSIASQDKFEGGGSVLQSDSKQASDKPEDGRPADHFSSRLESTAQSPRTLGRSGPKDTYDAETRRSGLRAQKSDTAPSSTRFGSSPSTEVTAHQSLQSLLSQESDHRQRVIYKLVCIDLDNHNKQVIRYQWEPFEGLERNSAERQQLAPIDVIDAIKGRQLTQRRSQQRETFETRDDKDPGAFIIGRDFQKRSTAPTHIRILSPSLCRALRDIIPYYPAGDLEEEEIAIASPYTMLFLYWKQLHDVTKDMERGGSADITYSEAGYKITIEFDDVLRQDLLTLLTIPSLQKTFSETVLPEMQLHDQGRATFNNLWLLFRPGDIVLAQAQDTQAGYVLEKCSSKFKREASVSHKWELEVWNLAYEAGKLVRRSHTFSITRYKGERTFAELSVIPIRVLRHHDEVKETLISRGRGFHKIICNEPCHLRYRGLFSAENQSYYEGEIIVDHKAFLSGFDRSKNRKVKAADNKEPGDFGGGPFFSKFNDMQCSVDAPLEDAQYLLLPHEIYGYMLEKKVWGIFEMDFVEEIEEEHYPLRHLKIKEETKKLVLASVGIPRQGLSLEPWTPIWAADFIDGKGKGRVVFLHGPPGTGKTMTVECIAKWARRPLLRLSAADLGINETTIQERLVEWLDLASRWGAIVLLDEAEVYLEQRQAGEIGRNALVTAFLRTMEYFPGLLFLTTNGIGLFDEAVMSRFHLAIQYDRVDQAQRAQIWASLFSKMDDDQKSRHAANAIQPRGTRASINPLRDQPRDLAAPHLVVDESAKDLALSDTYNDVELNGRDIRNVLLTAISLATRDTWESSVDSTKEPAVVVVNREHLDLVLRKKRAIRESYRLARGGYPEDIAAERYARGKS